MIFSVLAFSALIISICIKDRRKSLAVQSTNCLFESIYAFTINAYTGAILGLINFIRSFIFIHGEKINKKIYVVMLILFECIIIGNCVYTWSGLISLLPTIGSVIRTYCLWQKNMKFVRISGITTGISYGLYYLYYRSFFIVIGYIILMIAGILSIYRIDIRNTQTVEYVKEKK